MSAVFKSAFPGYGIIYSQSQRRISPCTPNHGILPGDSAADDPSLENTRE